MFKKLQKWINKQLLIFLERKIQIQQLKEERDFWKKEAHNLINNYRDSSDINLELVNIQSFLNKETNDSFVKR